MFQAYRPKYDAGHVTIRLAMWSGPRNISTAMMRAWGNRPDTIVIDEPFYAHYLLRTGLPHPGADEVIARHETDWRAVVAQLTGPLPPGKTLVYQKHMTHHLLPEIDRAWLRHLTHAFLIRDPREMLLSLVKNIPEPTLQDTGLPQQVEIYEFVSQLNDLRPPVLDARDVLKNPRRMLGLLCDVLHIPFDESMLSWPPGPRETDGVWAKYWYHSVERSTTFESYLPKNEATPHHLRPLLDQCMRLYAQLHEVRLR